MYLERGKNTVASMRVRFWAFYYKVGLWLIQRAYEKRGTVLLLLIAATFIVAGYLTSRWSHDVEKYFTDPNSFSNLQTLFLSLGSALIGATAIAFSLVMFAMQINVERLPHGLFRRFSGDVRLLLYFFATFTFAVVITSASLIPDYHWATSAIYIATGSLLLIVVFLLAAYRRALNLVNPVTQLKYLQKDTDKYFKRIGKAIERYRPLLVTSNQSEDERPGIDADFDVQKAAYFEMFPNWASPATRKVQHCISFARRFSEQGDHEVAGAALDTVIDINRAYIATKGKTFFSNDALMIDNPLSRDSFITATLEEMRQYVQVAVSRKDERQISQALRAIFGLCQVYCRAQYASPMASKTHAHLAHTYLSGAVEALVPHGLTDLLMEGVRVMADGARLMILERDLEQIPIISEKITIIASAGVATNSHIAVTQTSSYALSSIVFDLIRCDSHDVRFAVREVRDDLKFLAKCVLATNDTTLNRRHSTSLGPYYSALTMDGFLNWLTRLVNQLLGAESDDENARRTVYHIKQWSDDLHSINKELFALAARKKSSLTFDIVSWTEHVSKILFAISGADACKQQDSSDLRDNAVTVVYALTWVPREKEAIDFVDNYRVTESLFRCALYAKEYGCIEEAIELRKVVLSWGIKASGGTQGQWTLLQACYAIATLSILLGVDLGDLISSIQRSIKEDELDRETGFLVADRLRTWQDERDYDRYTLDPIEHHMSQVDQSQLASMFDSIAQALAPEFAGSSPG